MRTSELAEEAGVNIQTLRYYERRGLLPKPARTHSGYRVYPPESVSLIRFVKRAQRLGFTLEEIDGLIRLRNTKRATCGEVSAAARVRLHDIEARLASLQAMRRALRTLLAQCGRGNADRSCPILESLDAEREREPRQRSRS